MDKRFVSSKLADAPPSTSYLTRQVPINSGNDIYLNQSIRFRIGGLQANQFLDPSLSFIKLTMTNQAATHSFYLPPSGALGMFRTAELTQAGAVISSFTEFGTMCNMFQKLNASTESASVHAQLYGAGIDTGALIGATQSHTVCIPLKYFSSLFWADKMIPLFSKDALELTLTLGDHLYGGFWGDAENVTGITDQSLKFTNAEMVMQIVQTAPSVTQSLMSVDGGKYIIETKGVGHNQYSIPANQTGDFTLNLGLGYSSLEAINFVHSANMVKNTSKSNAYEAISPLINDVTKNFTRNFLKSYGLSVDGTLIESLRSVQGRNDVSASEYLAMALIQKGVLSKDEELPAQLTGYTKFTANNPAEQILRFGTDEPMVLANANNYTHQKHSYSTVNTLDVCVYKMKKEGICSGRNVLGSSTQLILDYDGTQSTCPLHVYSTFRQLCILDLNGSGLWNVIQ